MRREIVQNDVDLLLRPARATTSRRKRDKVLAGVARRGFAVHLPGLGIQCRVQRQRAVAIVFEPMPFGASGGQRQHRVQPIQRLNRRLFIHTEHGRMLRWIQIQADNVGRFRSKSGSSLAK